MQYTIDNIQIHHYRGVPDPPHWTPERRDFMLPEPIVPDSEGYIMLPDEPGLGVSFDWASLEPLKINNSFDHVGLFG